MSSNDKKNTEADQLADITRNLKYLAKEYNIAIIAISQLNRRAFLDGNNTPHLKDLRSSGSIANDADVVIIINRTKEKLIECFVCKNRHGKTGCFYLNQYYFCCLHTYQHEGVSLSNGQPEHEKINGGFKRKSDEPVNKKYIATCFDISEEEVSELMLSSGLTYFDSLARQQYTELGKSFLHPNPIKNRKWKKEVIDFLRNNI